MPERQERHMTMRGSNPLLGFQASLKGRGASLKWSKVKRGRAAGKRSSGSSRKRMIVKITPYHQVLRSQRGLQENLQLLRFEDERLEATNDDPVFQQGSGTTPRAAIVSGQRLSVWRIRVEEHASNAWNRNIVAITAGHGGADERRRLLIVRWTRWMK
jgi:N-acetylmuramoyl-L-alanine amidase